MNRKLATLEVIKDLQPIPGADNIEVATVRGWKVVVRKGLFEIGSLCVFFLKLILFYLKFQNLSFCGNIVSQP